MRTINFHFYFQKTKKTVMMTRQQYS